MKNLKKLRQALFKKKQKQPQKHWSSLKTIRHFRPLRRWRNLNERVQAEDSAKQMKMADVKAAVRWLGSDP